MEESPKKSLGNLEGIPEIISEEIPGKINKRISKGILGDMSQEIPELLKDPQNLSWQESLKETRENR